MKRSKTEYRGDAAIKLATSAVELTVTTDVGPRVVSFGSTVGRAGNMFIQFPPDMPRANGYSLRGGHRLWHSPEDIVRTYQPDDMPLAVRELPNGVALTQLPEEKTNLQKALRIELIGQRTVKVTHTIHNRGLWAVEFAPWALTMFRTGGYGVIPLLPKGSHADGDLLPGYALVPWSYTDLSLPLWEPHRDFLGMEVSKARTAQKLGLTHYPGWSAYWLEGSTFVKTAPVVPGARYPDLGCCFETFTNGEMIELETLGPLAPLAPGGAAVHVEHWTIIDGLKKPNTDAAFAKLASEVRKWLARL